MTRSRFKTPMGAGGRVGSEADGPAVTGAGFPIGSDPATPVGGFETTSRRIASLYVRHVSSQRWLVHRRSAGAPAGRSCGERAQRDRAAARSREQKTRTGDHTETPARLSRNQTQKPEGRNHGTGGSHARLVRCRCGRGVSFVAFARFAVENREPRIRRMPRIPRSCVCGVPQPGRLGRATTRCLTLSDRTLSDGSRTEWEASCACGTQPCRRGHPSGFRPFRVFRGSPLKFETCAKNETLKPLSHGRRAEFIARTKDFIRRIREIRG